MHAPVHRADGTVSFHMEAVTVDKATPGLTAQEQMYLAKGLTKPWTEWRVIHTNTQGKQMIHLRLDSEAEADAAMAESARQEAARRDLDAQR